MKAYEIIEKVIAHFETHGLAVDEEGVPTYWDGKGNSCAVGCLLEYPEELQTYIEINEEYAVRRIFDSSCLPDKLRQDIEKILPEDLDKRAGITFLSQLQAGHDTEGSYSLEAGREKLLANLQRKLAFSAKNNKR